MGIRHIFVYGTLMRGMSNHDRFCRDALNIEPAVTTGRLYHLPYGFPAMFDAPDGQVFGEVMTFPDIGKTLERLDRLEGYRPGDIQSHYVRIAKTVTILNNGEDVLAWTYIYPNDRMRTDFTPVLTDCWRIFMSSIEVPV
ncbi:MAG: Gamma-L-glutamyl-butirosin B gamma-glutamyl cyclotransferase [bacterium ADurb.Bin236]|nr:MAG: Gamma-L-glutamyl-butirosin B gamma-glutamyl cyclotransferase [bacterium ADurb.Bin236]